MEKINISLLKEKGYDVDFILDTQPVGNIRFLDNMTQTGNAYMASLYFYRYPSQPEGLWQALIHNIENSFVITDIANQESGEVLQKVQRAIREQYNRMIEEKEAYDAEIAQEEYVDLNYLGKALRRTEEVMKYFTLRLVLYADTKQELEKRVVEVRKYLEKNQFGATVLVMEQEHEYQAMFLDHSSQSYLPNKRVGRDIPSSQIALTFPANHVYLHDRRGLHLGYSLTNGNIFFDCFELDGVYRQHYNVIILGQMGSGKSTLMKKLLVNMGAKGTHLRGFDKSGEFTKVIDYLDGKIVALDGSSGTINIFQVFPTVLNNTTNEIDEISSFTQHKSKIATWYGIIKPSVTNEELAIFELALNRLYQNYWNDQDEEKPNYTQRHNSDYPLLEEFLQTVETMLNEPNNTATVRTNLEMIHLTFDKLVSVYDQLFNQYTSLGDVITEQILFFNIDNLMAMDNKTVIDAQLFNALNLFWASLVNHGKEQVRQYNNREVSFDQIKRSMLVIDECHNLINQDNPRLTKFINTMQREGRKLFIGVMLATQSLSSLAPEVIRSEASEMLREIYTFSQYRFYFQISTANIEHLKRLSNNEVTAGQVERIARYPQGRCLLSFSGTNIEFNVEASDRELELFSGGGKRAD